MPHVQAFRGLRYDLGHIGTLSDVIAPPYDVINAELQDDLYKKHPANVVRLILNRDEPGDDEHNNRYSRASRFLKNWRREGVLQTESDPAFYVYHQLFSFAGQEFTRRGFMSRVRLERFGEGKIYPHEETHSAAKADRLKLTTACRANLSQIFGLYPDEDNAAQDILEAAVAGVAPLEAVDHLGVKHRLWPVTDVKTIGEVSALVDPKPMYVADGHHRYETACNYRDQLEAKGKLTPQHGANYVMTMCVSMSDPGMIVLPTHRLFRGLPKLTSSELIEKLGGCFDTKLIGQGSQHANSIWETIEVEDEQGSLGLYTSADDTWITANISEAGRNRLQEIVDEPADKPADKHSSDWCGLGVSILHRLLVEDLLGVENPPSPKYVHSVDEIIEGIEQGDSSGRDATGQAGQEGKFPLAALVMPATLDHIRAISQHNERMPAKSTYFFPKLLSGLVIHPLE